MQRRSGSGLTAADRHPAAPVRPATVRRAATDRIPAQPDRKVQKANPANPVCPGQRVTPATLDHREKPERRENRDRKGKPVNQDHREKPERQAQRVRKDRRGIKETKATLEKLDRKDRQDQKGIPENKDYKVQPVRRDRKEKPDRKANPAKQVLKVRRGTPATLWQQPKLCGLDAEGNLVDTEDITIQNLTIEGLTYLNSIIKQIYSTLHRGIYIPSEWSKPDQEKNPDLFCYVILGGMDHPQTTLQGLFEKARNYNQSYGSLGAFLAAETA